MHVLDATIQPRRNKGTVSDVATPTGVFCAAAFSCIGANIATLASRKAAAMGPPRGYLARHHCLVRGRWGICCACHSGGEMPHCNARGHGSAINFLGAPGSSWISSVACPRKKIEGDGGDTQRRWKMTYNERQYNSALYAADSAYSRHIVANAFLGAYSHCWLDCGVGLGTHRFGFGHCAGSVLFARGPPLGALGQKSARKHNACRGNTEAWKSLTATRHSMSQKCKTKEDCRVSLQSISRIGKGLVHTPNWKGATPKHGCGCGS